MKYDYHQLFNINYSLSKCDALKLLWQIFIQVSKIVIKPNSDDKTFSQTG